MLHEDREPKPPVSPTEEPQVVLGFDGSRTDDWVALRAETAAGPWTLTEALEDLERTDADVRAARESYARMVDRILGSLPAADIRAIYGGDDGDMQ